MTEYRVSNVRVEVESPMGKDVTEHRLTGLTVVSGAAEAHAAYRAAVDLTAWARPLVDFHDGEVTVRVALTVNGHAGNGGQRFVIDPFLPADESSICRPNADGTDF